MVYRITSKRFCENHGDYSVSRLVSDDDGAIVAGLLSAIRAGDEEGSALMGALYSALGTAEVNA